MTKEEIGAILKELRTNSGKTQSQVAKLIGRTQQIIGHWETGYSQPDANTLFVLCDIYGVSVDTAFGFNNTGYNSVERELIANLRNLNEEGKEYILKQMNYALSQPEYKKHNQLCMGEEKVPKQA